MQGETVDLPPRPLLLTFDDARADSWTGSDGILQKLGFNAVMFVDVGRVDDGNPEYLTWEELKTVQASGRWELQLHSGHGHQQIQYGPGPNDYGPFYAYEQQGEDFDGWQNRVRSDIEWGQFTLADHVPAYRPLAFAPPYGNYGQDGTNDPRIPEDLLGWLTERYGAVFTQDRNALAHRGSGQPLGRIQVTRASPAATSTPSCCPEPPRHSARARGNRRCGRSASTSDAVEPTLDRRIAPRCASRRRPASIAARKAGAPSVRLA